MTVAIQLAFDKNDKIVICFAPTPDSVNYTELVKTKVEELMENMQVQSLYEYFLANMGVYHLKRRISK